LVFGYAFLNIAVLYYACILLVFHCVATTVLNKDNKIFNVTYPRPVVSL